MVLMTDASFTAAGYALMTENDPDQKIQSKKNVCFSSIWVKDLQSNTN